MFVSSLGYEIPKTDAGKVRRARTDLTVAPAATPSVPRPLRFIVYAELADRLIVPYFYGIKTFGPPVQDVRPRRDPVQHLCFAGQLREAQPQAVAATLGSMRSVGGAVLSLGTGQGKTACALYIACELRAKTIVVVNKSFLADQWADRVRQFIPAASVSRIQAGVCDTSGDIVIAMVQTLVSRSYPARTFDPFTLMIFDECHHIGAPVFSRTLLGGMNARYTLGLSATPARKDGLERIIHYFLGPLAHAHQATDTVRVTVEIAKYTCPAYTFPPPANVRGDVDHSRMLSMLAEDAARTEAIAGIVARALRGRDVLVLSHRRAHCAALALEMCGLGLDAAAYVGGARTVPPNKIIVSTYAFVSEGFDEPRLDALVLATPASNVTQAIGRVMRRPQSQPRVIDVVDSWSVCYAQASKRRKQYLEAGHVVQPLAQFSFISE